MAATKSASTIIAAGTSNAAAATTIGTAVDLTTKYGAFITGILTNGGTAPTVPATAFVEVSIDNTNWKVVYSVAATVTANAVLPWSYRVSMETLYARVRVSGNTGQAVTCESFAHILAS